MGLVECIRQARVPDYENVLVVVDQFEELFRFKRSSQQRDSRDEAVAFVKLLLAAARQDAIPVYVVITMRSDFIGNCTEFEGLTEAINDGQYLVPRMTREERRDAITGPVAVSGAEMTQRLVLRLLNDVGDDPDQLPILQHALMRTWDEWNKHHAEGEPIDLRHYEAIGTMKEALSQHAEEAFRELADERSRQIAERMFKSLTDLGSDARGVRSPRPLEEICALTDAAEAEVVPVVEAFRRPGRSFLMPPVSHPLRGASIIDISHESLMRIWKRLIHWVDEEARSAQTYLRISKAAAQFQEGKAGLLHDPELQLAVNWREETKPNAVWAQRYDVAFERAMVFLEHSRKQRDLETEEKERQRRRQLQWARRLAVVLGLAALVTLVFGLYAVTARMEAEQNFKETLRQKTIADEQRKEAETQRELADAQRMRTEQARATAEEQRVLAESQRQRAEQQEQEALRQKGQADAARALEAKARTDAEQQRQAAVQQKERAETLRVQAEQSESEARRLRVLSVARELAIKTSQLVRDDQRELAALLAVQAYRLHRRSGGDPADPDIFEALRAAVARVAPAEVRALRYHTDAVRALAVSPSSGLVASGSDDGTVRLLDLGARSAQPAHLGTPGSEVRALAWVDGAHLAVGSLDGVVRVFSVPAAGGPIDPGRSPRRRERARGARRRDARLRGPGRRGPALAVARSGGGHARAGGRRQPRRLAGLRPERAAGRRQRRQGRPALGPRASRERAASAGAGPQDPRRRGQRRRQARRGHQRGTGPALAVGARPPAGRAVRPHLGGHLPELRPERHAGSHRRVSTAACGCGTRASPSASRSGSRATPAGSGPSPSRPTARRSSRAGPIARCVSGPPGRSRWRTPSARTRRGT